MIWVWLKSAALWCLSLIIPPPAAQPIPKIDANAPCPSCGNTQGEIRAVVQNNQALVQHTCKVCRARWHELPVLRVQNVIHAKEEQ